MSSSPSTIVCQETPGPRLAAKPNSDETERGRILLGKEKGSPCATLTKFAKFNGPETGAKPLAANNFQQNACTGEIRPVSTHSIGRVFNLNIRGLPSPSASHLFGFDDNTAKWNVRLFRRHSLRGT